MRTLALNLVLSLSVGLAGCATLETTTQRVRVISEPPGAAVAALDDVGRKELGAAPVEYQRDYQAYRCSNWVWLTPLGTAALGSAAGFGLAYATTHRNDQLESGWQGLALVGAIGLVVGIAVAAECWMKDGVVPEHRDVQVLIEASKDGYRTASAPLKVPSNIEELRLVLPELGASAPTP